MFLLSAPSRGTSQARVMNCDTIALPPSAAQQRELLHSNCFPPQTFPQIKGCFHHCVLIRLGCQSTLTTRLARMMTRKTKLAFSISYNFPSLYILNKERVCWLLDVS